MRAKWRLLGKDIEQAPEDAHDIIKCMCILHNVIRERDGNDDLHYNQVVNQIYQEDQMEVPQGLRIRYTTESREIRDTFTDYMMHH